MSYLSDFGDTPGKAQVPCQVVMQMLSNPCSVPCKFKTPPTTLAEAPSKRVPIHESFMCANAKEVQNTSPKSCCHHDLLLLLI